MNRHNVATAAAAPDPRWTGRRHLPSLALAALLASASPTPALSQGGDPPQSPSDCALVCGNGGVCQKGDASFPDKLRISNSGGGGGGGNDDPPNDSSLIPFLRDTSDGGGEFCWCPEGWTGYDCAHDYDWCGPPGDEFPCFHGAECKQFGINYFCDCKTGASPDGTRQGQFAGFQCEYSAADVCMEGSGGFCVNDGFCKPGETQQQHMCECPPEWTGPHCELRNHSPPPTKVDATIEPVSPNNCGLDCTHDGVCQYGSAKFPDHLRLSNNGAVVPFLQRTNNHVREYCLCPEGWTGYDCAHQYKYCWEELNQDGTWDGGFACFYGGICKNIPGAGPKDYICDCAAASLPDGSSRGLFAGTHCEYMATSTCWKGGERIGFCANAGTCAIDAIGEMTGMCDCPPEWDGPHCEVYKGKAASTLPTTTTAAPKADTAPAKPNGCSLQCAHNGVCQKGAAEFPSNLKLSANNAIVPFMQRTTNGIGEYCWCPDGWTSYDCAHEYKYCWEKPGGNGTWGAGFACFHGGTCKGIPTGGNTDYICDCSTSSQPDGTQRGMFAGTHCEHSASDGEICRKDGNANGPWIGFCLNGGTCKTGEVLQSRMCDCPTEWAGPHCEFYKGDQPKIETVATTTTAPSPDCSLKCANGGVCQKGTAEFGILARSADDNSVIPFLQEQSDANGEYCSCQKQWTGIACHHKYEFCWDKLDSNFVLSEGFACFHGSTCVANADARNISSAYSCDCSEAHSDGTDKGMFAGRQCQFRATEECLSKDLTERVGFCVNDGKCNRDRIKAGDLTQMCDCPPGWKGSHCEVRSKQQSGDQDNERPAFDPTCNLNCPKDGVCQKGKADYGIISPQNFAYSSPIPFLEKTSDGTGQYCWCPPGLTGVQCQHKYELCDPNSDDERTRGFSCFHSSKCTDLGVGSLKTWACDCSTANNKGNNEGLFAGRFCEHEVTTKCKSDLSEKSWFCVNGGTCKEGESNAYKICQCPSGWTGPHCEYAQKSVASTQYSPKKCTLNCLNKGKCMFGVKDYGDHADINEAKELSWLSQTHSDGMHCVCPTGFTGLNCQIPAEKCGNRLWCYNGSQCKKTEVKYGAVKNYCDCSEAATNQASFAGIGCQHKSGVFCEPVGERKEISFCVNGGSCYEIEDGPFGCDCPDGWSGQHCEFHKSEAAAYSNPKKCKLECKNGGKCLRGVKDYGTLDEHDLPFLSEEHVDFEHCACPAGFTGLDCSVKWVGCDDKHVCVHGSKCEAKGQTGSFTCNCEGVKSEKGNSVAGEHCQHEATEYCVVGQISNSFCTNGGVCIGPVAANQAHPGCVCPSGWTGDRCEIRQKEINSVPSTQSNTIRQSADETKQAAILFSVMVAIIAVIIVIAVVLTKKCASVEALQREDLKRQQEMQGGNRDDKFNSEPVQSGPEEAEEGHLDDVDIL